MYHHRFIATTVFIYRKVQLLVIIVPVCCQYNYHNIVIVDFIHEPVFACDTPTPLPGTVAAQQFRLAGTCFRVLI